MRVAFTLRTPIVQSARVVQTASMFDLPLERGAQAEVSFDFDVPIDGDRPWSIGLIVGPSGAGKSSVARHLFGDDVIPETGYEWHLTSAGSTGGRFNDDQRSSWSTFASTILRGVGSLRITT